MNKRLLVLAVAGAFGASGSVLAHDHDGATGISVKGHAETLFVASDDTEGNERRFHTEGEVSFTGKIADDLYGRVDLDLNSRYSDYFNDGDDAQTVEIEQIFGAWRINDMAKLKVGRFNNPLGYEKQDAPYKTTASRSLVSMLLDEQTQLYQNNIEGVAVDLDFGPAQLTLGVLNEIGGTAEENSLLAQVRGEVIPGLNLALGILTQEDFEDSANDAGFASYGNLVNFYADYTLDLGGVGATFFVDYLTGSDGLDAAYSIGAKAKVTDAIGLTLRYDVAEYDFANDFEETAIALGVNYRASKNLDFRAEWYSEEQEDNTGKVDNDSVILSAVFKF